MADLLLELFSEEIPARMQADAIEHFKKSFFTQLAGRTGHGGWRLDTTTMEKLTYKEFVTPRRLAIQIGNLPDKTLDSSTEYKGPKIDAPEAAVQGFLKKHNVTVDLLEKRDGTYFLSVHQTGKHLSYVIKEIAEDILKSFPWPKSMRWGSNDAVWVRPLSSILCIFNGEVVSVEFAGITASNVTCGHRFLSPKEIKITKAGDYESALEKAHVIADRGKRRKLIEDKALALAKRENLRLERGCDALLDEVAGLVEWPVTLMGNIDSRFMELPPEVLSTVMKKHQKYFPLLDGSGQLAPRFLIVSNMETKDEGRAIIAGNERVLRARFSDARFFWDQDRKKKLDEWAKGLEHVTFHARLGTIADKAKRINALAMQLADITKADRPCVERAALLCKADLVTGMVGEFPELQGIMGGYYAAAQENSAIADAIRDHYKPQGPNDTVPKAPVSVCIALADKLDTLVSMFAIGEKPTGSKDPFALRRAALGVIRIILENNLRLPLAPLLDEAPLRDIALHKAQDKLAKKTDARLREPHKVGKYLTVNESACEDIPEGAAETVARSLLAFFHDRLIVQMRESGLRHDVIKAVVANGDDDLVRIVNRAKAVQAFLDTEDGKNLLSGYRRAANIVAIEEKKDKTVYKAADLKLSLLKEKEEKELAALLDTKAAEIKSAMDKENFAGAMKALAGLRQPVDLFFDKVMVNCDDKDLRAARLRLLSRIRGGMDAIADFSAIEGDAKEQKKAA